MQDVPPTKPRRLVLVVVGPPHLHASRASQAHLLLPEGARPTVQAHVGGEGVATLFPRVSGGLLVELRGDAASLVGFSDVELVNIVSAVSLCLLEHDGANALASVAVDSADGHVFFVEDSTDLGLEEKARPGSRDVPRTA
jgi:hypothetical protein